MDNTHIFFIALFALISFGYYFHISKLASSINERILIQKHDFDVYLKDITFDIKRSNQQLELLIKNTEKYEQMHNSLSDRVHKLEGKINELEGKIIALERKQSDLQLQIEIKNIK